jgi:hypothetical protein
MGRDYDAQAALTAGVRGPEVDHGASVVDNLKSAGKHLLEMVLPDKTPYCAFGGFAGMMLMGAGPWAPLKGLALGLGADVYELVAGPFLAVKDLTDAAAHGILAGFRG